MKCKKSGSHVISYQSLLLSTIILNGDLWALNVAKYILGFIMNK